MRASLTLKPATALSASNRVTLASSRMLSSRLCAITGSMTFSWKLPDWPAIVMLVSLPMTCAATMVAASGITGFTLPGMMLLPGWSGGSAISPSPASGPLFIRRRSLAIFMRLTAMTFSCPDSSTAVSCADMASK